MLERREKPSDGFNGSDNICTYETETEQLFLIELRLVNAAMEKWLLWIKDNTALWSCPMYLKY